MISLSKLRRVTSGQATYMPEVDGLRFLAIMGVLLFHWIFAVEAVGKGVCEDSWLWQILYPFRQGHRGVELFFAISGFILSLPFAKEQLSGQKRVDLKKFYFRRLTRIEPPYLIALVGIYILTVVMQGDDSKNPEFWSGFLARLVYGFLAIYGELPKLNGVTWSLEIEVQFYLISPFIVRYLLASGSEALQTWRIVIGIVFFALIAQFFPALSMNIGGHAQHFFAGILACHFFINVQSVRKVKPAIFDFLGFTSLAAMILLPKTVPAEQALPWLCFLTILSALFGHSFKILLSLQWVTIIGGMCYSIYLLHYPVLSFLADRPLPFGLPDEHFIFIFPLIAFPCILVPATLFFILIERPCMNPNWYREVPQAARALSKRLFGKK